ncbi:MAG TPA: periplasmic heavy metal sensor [bacterium]|nr:periplasmic heavy metal sensor [bacterium]
MKKSYLIATVMVLMATLAMAQTEPVNPDPMPQRPMMGRHLRTEQRSRFMDDSSMSRFRGHRIPDLTEEQKKKIDELQTAHFKTIKPLQDELQEKQARFRTLSTAEKVDRKALDTLIESMGSLRIKMRKHREALHQDIRALLNENQRVWMDRRHGFGRSGRCIGMGMGTHHGFGTQGKRGGRGGRGGW